MTLIQSVILGLVEGITEFLPISSTAHLILSSNLLHLQQTSFQQLFEIVIQFGAILAVALLYWRKVWEHKNYFFLAVVAFIPTALVGYLMKHSLGELFQSTNTIGYSLIVVGLLFVVVELLIQKGVIQLVKDIDSLTYKDALLIGLIQSTAIVPGVSRAGAVLVIMMLLGYKRSDSALFSFILAIPTIAGAAALSLLDAPLEILTSNNILLLAVGSLVALGSALVCVKWLVTYLQKNTLAYFSLYRIVVGIGVLMLLK